MVSVHEGRVLLAKSRRLLVASQRLLADLEDLDRLVSRSDMRLDAPSKDRTDRFQTRRTDAGIDGPAALKQAGQRERDAGSEPWHRPRRPR
jgi:hypothetical protein